MGKEIKTFGDFKEAFNDCMSGLMRYCSLSDITTIDEKDFMLIRDSLKLVYAALNIADTEFKNIEEIRKDVDWIKHQMMTK